MVDVGVTLATLKAIAGVAKDANKIGLYNDIIGLQQTILEMLEERTNAVGEIAKLRETCADLERRLAERGTLEFENNVYWRVGAKDKDQGALCPRCYDGSGKLSRMMTRDDTHYWVCMVCDLSVQKPGPDPNLGENVREVHRPLRQSF